MCRFLLLKPECPVLWGNCLVKVLECLSSDCEFLNSRDILSPCVVCYKCLMGQVGGTLL